MERVDNTTGIRKKPKIIPRSTITAAEEQFKRTNAVHKDILPLILGASI